MCIFMANEHCWSDWGIDNDLVQFHEKLLKNVFPITDLTRNFIIEFPIN